MSTDSIDPTRAPGIVGGADTGTPHSQAPEGPDASGTRSTPKVSPFSPRGKDGSDPRRRPVAMRSEVSKTVIDQEAAVIGLVVAPLVDRHVLLEGVPGVAKTLLIRSLTTALDLETKRIQSAPGLMPGDVAGSLTYDSRSTQFFFRAGPASTNLLLADEINRIPPKTQSTLLRATEERQVSIDDEPRTLSDPLMVITIQNLVKYEGTYPLPEAQLDRFLFKLVLPLPERIQEIEVLSHHTSGFDPHDLLLTGLRAVAGVQGLTQTRIQASTVGVTPEALVYAVDLVHATRSIPSVALGVSPRGATALLAAPRAWVWLTDRSFITPDNIKTLALPILRHRIKLHAEAEMGGITPQSVIETVLRAMPAPR